MTDLTFYSTENDHNIREVEIIGATLLIGRKPVKEKRIDVKVRMNISNESVTGAPEWIDDALSHVLKNHDKVVPPHSFNGFDIEFSVDNLFGPKDVKTSGAHLGNFVICEYGVKDDPDVVLLFTIRIPFSDRRWRWIGQYTGQRKYDSIYMKFTPGQPGKSPTEDTTDDFKAETDTDEEDEEEDDSQLSLVPAGDGAGDAPENPTPSPAGKKKSSAKKSRAKDLKSFHDKQSAKKKPAKKAAKKK